MSRIFRGKSAAQVSAEYDKEPWGKLLIKYGFKPYHTESSARSVAQKAVDDITTLTNLLYSLYTPQGNSIGPEVWKKLQEFKEFKTK